MKNFFRRIIKNFNSTKQIAFLKTSTLEEMEKISRTKLRPGWEINSKPYYYRQDKVWIQSFLKIN